MVKVSLTAFSLVLCALMVPSCFGQYDFEPNNVIGESSSLPLNTDCSGSVNGNSDPRDWYKIEIPADGELTITVTHDPSDFQFLLYGTTESEQIAGTETNAPSGRQIYLTLQQGDYHLQINSRNNATPVPYTVSTVFVQSPSVTQDMEPNDTYDIASELTLNATQTGHIDSMGVGGFVDGLDYYAIDLTQDATVTISVAYEPDDFGFQFILYGANGTTQITGTQTAFPSGDSKTVYLAKGSYFLLINGRSFHSIYNQGRTYYLRVSADAHPAVAGDLEPNNSVETASYFDPSSGTSGHISFVSDDGSLDNLDYWSLTVPGMETAGVWITLEYDPPQGEFQFYVLNSEGAFVGSTGTGAPSPYKIDFRTEPGQHFLVINGRGNYIGRTYKASVLFYDPETGTPTPTSPPTPTSTPVPVQTPNSVHSDVNNDGIIDINDMLILQSDWHKYVQPRQE